MSMSSSSNTSVLNFNDLPDEIPHAIFDLFDPFERAEISPTCKKWRETINSTSSWWRTLELGQDVSINQVRLALQIFSSRSKSTLEGVAICKRIDKKKHLEEFFKYIEPSAKTMRIFQINQAQKFNTLTRRFADNLPALTTLVTASEGRAWDMRSPKESELRSFCTDTLRNLEEKDLKSFSQLRHLEVQKFDSIQRILSNMSRIETKPRIHDYDFCLEEDDKDTLLSYKTIEMKSLKSLGLPNSLSESLFHYQHPNLTVPQIESLSGNFESIKQIQSSSLKLVPLWLYDGEGDEPIQDCRLFLSNNERLESIHIDCMDYSSRKQINNLIRELTVYRDEQTLCPNPKRIEFQSSNEPGSTYLSQIFRIRVLTDFDHQRSKLLPFKIIIRHPDERIDRNWRHEFYVAINSGPNSSSIS